MLVNLLLDDMKKANGARCCIVGSITGNTNTVGGGLVYPFADLGDLSGFAQGGTNPIAMADGKPFFGAKAYKDAKVRTNNVFTYLMIENIPFVIILYISKSLTTALTMNLVSGL